MAANLFVYGSLAFPSVWNSVVRGRYDSSPARLEGYRRFAIRGQSYPGMTGDGGCQVPGRVYRDLDVADLDRLDRFEGDDYLRVEVDVAVPETGERLAAFAYLYLPVDRGEPHDWDPVAFERDALADFLRQYPPPSDR